MKPKKRYSASLLDMISNIKKKGVKMKKLLIAFCVASVSVAALAIKVATVDMVILVKNHPAYDTNKTLLLNTEKDLRKKLEDMNKELTAIQEEGKKHAETLRNPMSSKKAKDDAEMALREIENRYMQQQQKVRAEMMRSQQELAQLEAGLLKAQSDDLKKRISKFADKNDYDLVIDSSAALYSKSSFNVTDAVLKEMGVDPAKAKRD